MADTTTKNEGIAPAIGHNSAAEIKTGLQTVMIETLTVWAPAKEQALDLVEAGLEDEIAIIAEAGQRAPIPARRLPTGEIEVLCKWHLVLALQKYLEQVPDYSHEIEINILSNASDAVGYRLLAQDAEPGKQPSFYANGLLFKRARDEFGSVTEAANACHVSKSTISKNIDVLLCSNILSEKITVAREINQRDAMWFMMLHGRDDADLADRAARERLLAAVERIEPATAKVVFAKLRKALKESTEKPQKNIKPLSHKGREIGFLKLRRNVPVAASLGDIADISPKDVGLAIAEAIAKLRTSEAY